MPEVELFSAGVERLLSYIRPYGRPTTAFPHGLNADSTYFQAGETLRQWFVRLVDAKCAGDPRRVAIEDGIAVFANLAWRSDLLRYASIPTLIVVGATLDDFYLDSDVPAIYLRLDLNYQTLGTPFSHPLAHIHVTDDSFPRFALDGGNCGNVILDYLEFIYRTYVPDKWLRWARRHWLNSGLPSAGDEENDPFERILTAFNDSQFDDLMPHTTVIRQIKDLLRNAKDVAFPSHMNGLDREILEYPLAR